MTDHDQKPARGAGGTNGHDDDAEGGLDAMSQASIEERLRTMFDKVAREPVPDRFLDLLNQLDGAEGAASGKGSAQ